jgi:hypothetical protein
MLASSGSSGTGSMFESVGSNVWVPLLSETATSSRATPAVSQSRKAHIGPVGVVVGLTELREPRSSPIGRTAELGPRGNP